MESSGDAKTELQVLKERFIERLGRNYPHLAKYLEGKMQWVELDFIAGEIVNCLLLGLGMASITLTNHLLEKAMKTALIYHEVGFVTISSIEDIGAYEKAQLKYGDEDLFMTINLCFDNGLISSETKDALHKYRKVIRNGFSHASAAKTFGARTARFAMGSFLKPGLSEIKEIKIAELHPAIQAHAINDFVEANALDYFNLVYDVIKQLETVLIKDL